MADLEYLQTQSEDPETFLTFPLKNSRISGSNQTFQGQNECYFNHELNRTLQAMPSKFPRTVQETLTETSLSLKHSVGKS